METICCLLSGADEPIRISDDMYDVDESLDEEEEDYEISSHFASMDRRCDSVKQVLPQPTGDMKQPLNIQVDPVRQFSLLIYI